jgi:aryl-alcohol dehydrogenase-like predicted oxidoreductase
MKRMFGKTGFEVTTFGLGGQASLQWTPDDVDPVSIILKAFDAGVKSEMPQTKK